MQTTSLHGKEVESSFVFYGVFYLAHDSSRLERISERKRVLRDFAEETGGGTKEE